MIRIVTISASYGAGGSVVTPALAAALGVPLLDRVLTSTHPGEGAPVVSEEAQAEERTAGIWERMLGAMAQAPDAVPMVPVSELSSDSALRREAEARLRRFVDDGAGVVLGWAGALVIDGAYCVRLTGPKEARIEQVRRLDDRLSHVEARARLEDTDRARSLYWKRLYRADITAPSHYHLTIDSTAIGLDAVTDLVVRAAGAFWSR